MRTLCVFVLVVWASLPLRAAAPATALEAVVMAKESVPGVVQAGKGIAAIPWRAVQCLRLPLGLVEMVLSPLPGIGFVNGLENTGRGIVAPFELCIAVLEMPLEVVTGLGNAARGLSR